MLTKIRPDVGGLKQLQLSKKDKIVLNNTGNKKVLIPEETLKV